MRPLKYIADQFCPNKSARDSKVVILSRWSLNEVLLCFMYIGGILISFVEAETKRFL